MYSRTSSKMEGSKPDGTRTTPVAYADEAAKGPGTRTVGDGPCDRELGWDAVGDPAAADLLPRRQRCTTGRSGPPERSGHHLAHRGWASSRRLVCPGGR